MHCFFLSMSFPFNCDTLTFKKFCCSFYPADQVLIVPGVVLSVARVVLSVPGVVLRLKCCSFHPADQVLKANGDVTWLRGNLEGSEEFASLFAASKDARGKPEAQVRLLESIVRLLYFIVSLLYFFLFLTKTGKLSPPDPLSPLSPSGSSHGPSVLLVLFVVLVTAP